MIVFYLVAFVYDKTIDNEIKNNPTLASTLTEFKYFHSFQSRPKALSAALSFQFRGISTMLTLVGSVFSLMMYLGLAFGIYFITQA
nr:hypothetical protein [Colwellia sp. D2M02]